ncbi:LexA family protein [Acinetobacter rathckeae]|uniref:LexA family protein n=1 Tax=Acinetobacter rathckeae TaxID=2605272 RepID=UPI0018A2D0BB|nr:S24 family peptidase [Acinetobacter rathckeae]MBF7687860.1 helix-turn-helix domain-containing protein [Acinetobacter rathckeae]MBF7687917.1 helix-turn-helix domain-containing protein [Acinetobacter rathckeae]MBF7696030.1 helix-turn-helix domain-containing protein [Acinetobacter rathckeae]
MLLHERIQQKLNEMKLKQADISRATGKSSVAVTKWLRGENQPKLESLNAIAELLNVSIEWLLTGKEDSAVPDVKNAYNNVSYNHNGLSKIPVLDFVQAGKFREVIYDGSNILGFTYSDYKGSLPEDIFSVQIVGKSMLPRFSEGDHIIIDPNLCAKPGDFVIAENSDYEVTFKKYRVISYDEYGRELFELIPLNPDFAKINSIQHKIRIIGVVVRHIQNLR